MTELPDIHLPAPVFIVGHPRSGTTLLASLINASASFAVPAETVFCRRLLPCGDASRAEDLADADELLARAAADLRLQDLQLDWEDVGERLAAARPTYRNLFAAILQSYRDKAGESRIAEKSPQHLQYVPLLLDWFPDAVVIGMERDGRAVVRSLKEVPWSRSPMFWTAVEWIRSMRLVAENADRFPDRFLRVRYEDLVTDPEGTLRDISARVGTALAPQAEQPASDGPVPAWERSWKQRASGPIDRSRVDRWRTDPASWSRTLAHWLMSETLRQRGYATEPGAPALAPLRRLLEGAVVGAISAREVLRHAWCRLRLPVPSFLSGRRRLEQLIRKSRA